MESGLMSGASVGGGSPGAYEPPSFGPEPEPAVGGFAAAPAFGQASTHNPVHSSGASPMPSYSGVNLAPAAAEALTIQVDTTLDPNGFDLSDGVASGDERAKAAQMFRKRERAKAYDADMTAKKASISKNIAVAFLVLVLIGASVAVYIAATAADDGGSHCAANMTVTRNTCTAVDMTREEDVIACDSIMALEDSSECRALHRDPASPGGPVGPALCRYASHTECRVALGPRTPAPTPPRALSPPPPQRPTTAAESWDFIGGATSPDSEGRYAAENSMVAWPGARSGSAIWSSGSSVFLLGGIGCDEVPVGVCGDTAWAQNGPEQAHSSFGTTPGTPVPWTAVHYQSGYDLSANLWCVWSVRRLSKRSMGVGWQQLGISRW